MHMPRRDSSPNSNVQSLHSEIFNKKHRVVARRSDDKRHQSRNNETTRVNHCSCESFPNSTLVCLDCQRQAQGSSEVNGTALVLNQKRRLSIESNDKIHRKKRRRKLTGRLDLFSQQFERTTSSEFDMTKDKFSPFRMYLGANANATVLPSFANFYSPIKHILGVKHHKKLANKPSSISDNLITKIQWNEQFLESRQSVHTGDKNIKQEASSQTEWKCNEENERIDSKKLLKESEFVNEIVRRCLWHISSKVSMEDAALIFDANKIAEDISKQFMKNEDKGADITTKTVTNGQREMNLAYDSEPIKPPFLTEPGPVFQVLVTEKTDKKPKKTTIRNPTPSKTDRTICLCDDQDSSKVHCFEDSKYKRMIEQLVDLLDGLYSDQAGCECEDESTRDVQKGTTGEFETLKSSESDGSHSGKSVKKVISVDATKKIKEDLSSQSVIAAPNFRVNEACPCDGVVKSGGGCLLMELFEVYTKTRRGGNRVEGREKSQEKSVSKRIPADYEDSYIDVIEDDDFQGYQKIGKQGDRISKGPRNYPRNDAAPKQSYSPKNRDGSGFGGRRNVKESDNGRPKDLIEEECRAECSKKKKQATPV